MQKMGGMCCKVTGLFVLLAGLSFLANGLGMWNNLMHVHLAVGIFLTLFGLCKLAHAMDACPTCEVKDEKMSGKKR